MLPAVPLRYMSVPDRYFLIRKKKIMTWPTALSTFLLNRMCDFIKNRVSVDKGFRLKELKVVAEVVLKFCGREVHPAQIYNHLRHCRVRWVHVFKLKRLQDMLWAEETTTIMMEDDVYFAHIKDNSKDADFINKPIENYGQMKIIFVGHIPSALTSPTEIHRAIRHLMEHKAHATRYLAMSPESRMSWLTSFLMKYYL